MNTQESANEQSEIRRQKLALRREAGSPFPNHFRRDALAGQLHQSHEDKSGEELESEQIRVKVAGRMMAKRVMGKASFAHLQDVSGKIQLFLQRDTLPEGVYNNEFKKFDVGDILGIEGELFRTKTGELTIRVDAIELLVKSLRALPEKFHGLTDQEIRYRQRYVDLIMNPEVRETFRIRSRIVEFIRRFLSRQDFLEVETPMMHAIPGGALARPFETHHNTLDMKLYLRVAPELYLKRLIVGGFDGVFEFAKDFRNEGMDRNHNPEFTMLEFYWAYSDYEDCMNLVEDLFHETAKKVGALDLEWVDSRIDLSKKFNRRSFIELLTEATGHDLQEFDEAKLRMICKEKDIDVEKDANLGQILDALMSNLVEPNLIEPTFVVDYPKALSPLAKTHRNGNPNIVERFELFIGGAEFANSFSELNDPLDQRNRLEEQARLKDLGDEEAQPIDEDFIQAMECGMPPTGGVGIGIDRLVMLLTGNRWIKDVILFPTLRSE